MRLSTPPLSLRAVPTEHPHTLSTPLQAWMQPHPCTCPPPQRRCLSLHPSLYLQRRQRHSMESCFAGRHIAGWHALEAAQLSGVLRAGTCSMSLTESIERHPRQLCGKSESADVGLRCFQAGPRRPGKDGWVLAHLHAAHPSRDAPAAHLPRRNLLQQRIDGGSCAHAHCDFVLRDGRMWRARLGGEAPLHPPAWEGPVLVLAWRSARLEQRRPPHPPLLHGHAPAGRCPLPGLPPREWPAALHPPRRRRPRRRYRLPPRRQPRVAALPSGAA